MYEHGMIAPAVALILWSLVMLLWLYAQRIPAMAKLKANPEQLKDDPTAKDRLPVSARRSAANYTHLMEQPTLFYAVCFSIQLLDLAHPTNIGLAWLYVTLRVVHSLVQATANIIWLRFTIFLASSVVLGILAVNAALGMGVTSWFS